MSWTGHRIAQAYRPDPNRSTHRYPREPVTIQKIPREVIDYLEQRYGPDLERQRRRQNAYREALKGANYTQRY